MKLRMNGAILTLPAYAFMEWTRKKFSIFLKEQQNALFALQ